MTTRKTFTPAQMRELAAGHGSQFLMDDMKAALRFAADVIEAADAVIEGSRRSDGVAMVAAPGSLAAWANELLDAMDTYPTSSDQDSREAAQARGRIAQAKVRIRELLPDGVAVPAPAQQPTPLPDGTFLWDGRTPFLPSAFPVGVAIPDGSKQ